jgi:hypothetical protein
VNVNVGMIVEGRDVNVRAGLMAGGRVDARGGGSVCVTTGGLAGICGDGAGMLQATINKITAPRNINLEEYFLVRIVPSRNKFMNSSYQGNGQIK